MQIFAHRRILRIAGILTVIVLLVLAARQFSFNRSKNIIVRSTTVTSFEGGLPVTGGPTGGKRIYLPQVTGPVPARAPGGQDIVPAGGTVLVGAGDIARCNVSGDEATAALIKNIPGTVMAIGDTAYDAGTASQFTNCYQPSWGAFKDRTRPAVGNHEYMTSGAAPYYNYFGAAAGPSGEGYYSYDLGAWHIVVLNSECSHLPGGCAAGSVQESWLKADLAAHTNKCTLAYWHEPLYSSGEHGNNPGMKTFWQDLVSSGAELVLNGHDHDYERFAPMDSNGVRNDSSGMREIVVGTGGGNQRVMAKTQPNSELRIGMVYGVIKLTLHDGSYDWQFLQTDGKTGDSGSANCH